MKLLTIRSARLRKHHSEKHVKALNTKIFEWDVLGSVEQMGQWIAVVDSAREVCSSARVAIKDPKSEWQNNVVKAAVKMKEIVVKDVLGAKNERILKRSVQKFIEEAKGFKKLHKSN